MKITPTPLETKNKSFMNWRPGSIHLNFANGNHISTAFGAGSYSDNYELSYDTKYKPLGKDNLIKSNTCEIMFTCGEKLEKALNKKFNDGEKSPFSYLSIENWAYIVNRIANEN